MNVIRQVVSCKRTKLALGLGSIFMVITTLSK